jgi:hypothetical protein
MSFKCWTGTRICSAVSQNLSDRPSACPNHCHSTTAIPMLMDPTKNNVWWMRCIFKNGVCWKKLSGADFWRNYALSFWWRLIWYIATEWWTRKDFQQGR